MISYRSLLAINNWRPPVYLLILKSVNPFIIPGLPIDMTNTSLKNLWLPCTQMKDYEQDQPLDIDHARGSYLICSNGQKIIDATSSWWCKSLGHNHPKLKEALIKQINKFEHTIGSNTIHDNLVALSGQLCNLMPHFSKALYASDGSSAVEIALPPILV